MTEFTQGHRKRLRERMLAAPDKLPDYELLELLLTTAVPRRDMKPLAKELLRRFSSIRGVLDARMVELQEVPGFGPALGAYWILLRELMARHAEGPARERVVLSSPAMVADMARQRLRGYAHEEIWVAYLDTQNRILVWEQASKGSVLSTQVHPRDVLERAITLKATSIIMVHNHPGGNAKPSAADLDMTQRLMNAATALNIRFLDHIIVTDDKWYSMDQEGLLIRR